MNDFFDFIYVALFFSLIIDLIMIAMFWNRLGKEHLEDEIKIIKAMLIVSIIKLIVLTVLMGATLNEIKYGSNYDENTMYWLEFFHQAIFYEAITTYALIPLCFF